MSVYTICAIFACSGWFHCNVMWDFCCKTSILLEVRRDYQPHTWISNNCKQDSKSLLTNCGICAVWRVKKENILSEMRLKNEFCTHSLTIILLITCIMIFYQLVQVRSDVGWRRERWPVEGISQRAKGILGSVVLCVVYGMPLQVSLMCMCLWVSALANVWYVRL